SSGMLRHARQDSERVGTAFPLVQASADVMPFADDSFDLAFSAFGAIPFVADSEAVMREVARVLKPGSRWVFAVTHPMRWIFPDDPGPTGLTVTQSYFDRTPYVEADQYGRTVYVEHHRTLGDYVRQLTATGFRLVDLVEPEWPEGHTLIWGQRGPIRGKLFPGTAIFVCLLDRSGVLREPSPPPPPGPVRAVPRPGRAVAAHLLPAGRRAHQGPHRRRRARRGRDRAHLEPAWLAPTAVADGRGLRALPGARGAPRRGDGGAAGRVEGMARGAGRP